MRGFEPRTGARCCATRAGCRADIRALLEAENAYADALLAPTAGLQKELVREMRARLKEDDSEPPQVDGPWAYYSRYRHGGQHRIYCRRPRGGGEEMVLIDGDERAEGRRSFISPPSPIRPITRSSPGAPTISARNFSPFAYATSTAARTSPTASSTRLTTSSGRAIRRPFSMSSRTRTIARSA